MKETKPAKEEMLEAIERSGYLFESRVCQYLRSLGFFVESNQVIIDPFTEKSREIDIIAEYFDWEKKDYSHKCLSKIHFVFEVKNNSHPLVLLSKFIPSPNIEDWLGIKEHQTVPKEMMNTNHYGFTNLLLDESEFKRIFTQYLSFQRKNTKGSELMALHPDIIHTGLGKICQYCEEYIDFLERETIGKENGYFKNTIHLPVLLISDDLYELEHEEDGKVNLIEVDRSTLIYNYHYKNEPSMAYIYIVTEKGLPDFINDMIELERRNELNMIELRKKTTN